MHDVARKAQVEVDEDMFSHTPCTDDVGRTVVILLLCREETTTHGSEQFVTGRTISLRHCNAVRACTVLITSMILRTVRYGNVQFGTVLCI